MSGYTDTYIHGDKSLTDTDRHTFIPVCLFICCGNKYVAYCDGVLVFGGETLHYLIMMMSVCCVANDVIGLS